MFKFLQFLHNGEIYLGVSGAVVIIDFWSEMGDFEVEFGILLVKVTHLCLQESDSLGLVGLVDEELFVLELDVG